MAGLIILAILFLIAPLVVAIVVAKQCGDLRLGLKQVERRLDEVERRSESPSAQTAKPARAIPPPLPAFLKPPQAEPATTAPPSPRSILPPSTAAVDWESILGVKLFAWIGGFALFLGVVFFVKYAF